MSSEPVLVAVGMKGLVLNADRELLVLQKPMVVGKNEEWDVPGGGIWLGEDPIDGIRREIKEESGLEVENIRLLDIATDMHPKRGFSMYIMYSAIATTSEVTISSEHQAFRWVTLDQALLLNMAQRYYKVITRLASNL